MRIGRFALPLLPAVLIVLAAGCGKSRPDKEAAGDAVKAAAQDQPSQPASAGTIARLHCLGKKQVAADTNAAYLMTIWNQPESARLEALVLDKLALGLVSGCRCPVPANQVPTTNYESLVAASINATTLRPVLEDLLNEESYLEIREAPTQSPEIALAVRLDPAQAARWQKNLATVLESLSGSRCAPAQSGTPGWTLPITRLASHGTRNLDLTRAGNWTVLGLAPGTNSLLADFLNRIQRNRVPFAARTTNFWIEFDLNAQNLDRALSLGWGLPDDFPGIAANVTGDGENVRSRANLEFSRPLSLRLPLWSVPTNIVDGPVVSFTAARGLALCLNDLVFNGRMPLVPEESFLWDREGLPFQMYFALLLPDPTNAFATVAPHIMETINARLTPNYGHISVETNACSLEWAGLAHAMPFLQVTTNIGPQYLFGGFALHNSPTRVLPPELAQHILDGTNLVYFDWEITGKRLSHWRYLDDVYRIIFDRHGPRLLVDCPSLQWASLNLTNLSHSVTEARVTGQRAVSISRKSSIGLTGFEINLLANWLEMPQFPCGLGAVLATNAAPLPDRAGR